MKQNTSNTNALAKLATSNDAELLCLDPVKIIPEPSIMMRDLVDVIDSEPSQMDDILIYLREDKLPDDQEQVRRVWYHAENYLLVSSKLYKKGVSTALLRCLNDKEAKDVTTCFNGPRLLLAYVRISFILEPVNHNVIYRK